MELRQRNIISILSRIEANHTRGLFRELSETFASAASVVGKPLVLSSGRHEDQDCPKDTRLVVLDIFVSDGILDRLGNSGGMYSVD